MQNVNLAMLRHLEKVTFVTFSSFSVQACSPQPCTQSIIFDVHAAKNNGLNIFACENLLKFLYTS